MKQVQLIWTVKLGDAIVETGKRYSRQKSGYWLKVHDWRGTVRACCRFWRGAGEKPAVYIGKMYI